MQIAGATCFVCQTPIGTEREAVGCPTCEVLAHQRCAADAACPRCHGVLVTAADLRHVVSRQNPAYATRLGPWFPVSPRKFALLCLCSFGIYEVYWLYQNWRRFRSRAPKDILPWARACFAPIWIIALLRRIRESAAAQAVTVKWSPELLGLLFIGFLASRLLWRRLFSLPPSDIPLLISLLSFVWLLPAVRTTQQVNAGAGNPEGVNADLSGANLAVISVGGVVLLFSVAGIFLGG